MVPEMASVEKLSLHAILLPSIVTLAAKLRSLILDDMQEVTLVVQALGTRVR